MKTRMLVIVASLAVLAASPAYAVMEFFGSDAMPVSGGLPAGLNDLINNKARVAGAVGPFADSAGYFVGDTAQLNAFLKAYALIPDAQLQVVLHTGRLRLDMKRYDNTDRKLNVDWSLSVSELYPGRANASDFKGKKVVAKVDIWLAGAIELDGLDVPTSLDVASGGEIEAFIDKHTRKPKDQRPSR